MNYWILAALALLVAWAVAVFVVAPATGWVHLPLAVGAVLLARGLTGRRRDS